MKKTHTPLFILTAIVLFSCLTTKAQLPITAISDTIYIDFNDFTGKGFSPTPSAGQLNSNTWSVSGMSDGNLNFGDSATIGDFARGTSNGTVSTGGIYAFNSFITGNFFGVQPIGTDFTPGSFILKIQNKTGTTITQLAFGYNIWTLNNEDRSNSLNFSYSYNNTSYTNISKLDFTTPAALDAFPIWNYTIRVDTLKNISIANDSCFYFKWTGDDVGGSGNRDEYGIDNVVIQPQAGTYPLIAKFSTTDVCLGDTAFFTDSSFSGKGKIVGRNWNFDDGTGTSNLQNPFYVYKQAGTYNVTLIVTDDSSNTDTAKQNIQVLQKNNATISSVSPLCINAAPITLQATTSGGTWLGSGITDSINGILNPSVAETGTHSITYTINGTCGDTDSITIIVGDTPSVVIIITDETCSGVCDGAIATFVTGGKTPYTYSFSDGSSTANITGLCSATYTVTITDAYGCISNSEGNVLSKLSQCDTTIGINNFTIGNQQSLNIYPNPSNGQFTLEINNSPSNIHHSQLIITNLLGQTVYQQTLNTKQETLNTKLTKGIYTLQLKSEAGVVNKKMVVQE